MYLGVFEGVDIMQKREMKEKVKQGCLRRVKLVARSKLYGGNFIREINAWAMNRAHAGILDLSDRELIIRATVRRRGRG